jgi:hypothetical protein
MRPFLSKADRETGSFRLHRRSVQHPLYNLMANYQRLKLEETAVYATAVV